MIYIGKSPYRVSLLGGGSDLDWFVKRYGRGMSIGFSISAYSTLFLKSRNLGSRGILNYSSREEYRDVESISHPIIRSCLERFNIKKKLEIYFLKLCMRG